MNTECRQLRDENARLRRELRERYDLSEIVGASRAARALRETAAEAASADWPVLICGELGAGKELVARAIHYNSSRADKPFVKLHCATVPERALEEELFGDTDGIPRGAGMARADTTASGTLFLDEIDRLNERTQARLMRILRRPPGEDIDGPRADGARTAGMRVVAATGRNLTPAVAAGLKAFLVVVPPLRDRRGDIPRLASHFLQKFARVQEKGVTRLSAGAADALMRYRWPGNVGELEDALEQAVFACEGQVIHVRHLPAILHPAESSHASLSAAMNAYETELIEDALKTARGNRAKAARLLGTTERIVNYRIKNLKIDYRRFRPAGAAHVPFRIHMPASGPAPGVVEDPRQLADGFA
jgi:Nif-specific regulatory protein